jgi:hypothetical protein
LLLPLFSSFFVSSLCVFCLILPMSLCCSFLIVPLILTNIDSFPFKQHFPLYPFHVFRVS